MNILDDLIVSIAKIVGRCVLAAGTGLVYVQFVALALFVVAVVAVAGVAVAAAVFAPMWGA